MLEKLKQGPWPIFILTSFSSVANLFLPIILTRLLTPEDIGIYKVFFLYMSLLPFLFLTGGPLHSVYYWVGKNVNAQKYLDSAFQLTCFLSFLIIILGVPLASPFAKFIGLTYQNVLILLFVAALWVPASFYKELKLALGHTIFGSLFGTVMELIKVILFITLAYLGYGINQLFLAFLAFLLLKFILTFLLTLKENINPFKIDFIKIKEVLTYCTPVALAGLLNFFVDKMDQLVLAKHLATEEFAFYSLGCLIVPPLLLLEMSVSKVLIPIISKNWEHNKAYCLEFYKKAISDTALILIPASFGLFVFAGPIIELLYTDSFSESAKYLKLFSFSYLVLIIPYDIVPRATGNTKWIFKMSLFISPLSLASVIGTSYFFGAYEVLIVSLAFKVVYRLLALRYSCQLMNWSIFSTFPLKKLSLFIGISFVLSLLSYLMKDQFHNALYWFLTCGTIFFIAYFVALIIPYKKGYFND